MPTTTLRKQDVNILSQRVKSRKRERILHKCPWPSDLQTLPWKEGPTLCWVAWCCVNGLVSPPSCPGHPLQKHWGSWGWGTSAWLPWSRSPMDGWVTKNFNIWVQPTHGDQQIVMLCLNDIFKETQKKQSRYSTWRYSTTKHNGWRNAPHAQPASQ